MTRKRRLTSVRLLGLVFVAIGTAPLYAIIVSSTDDDGQVIAGIPRKGVNLDGVAFLGTDLPDSTSVRDIVGWCSGALISDRHILSAAHCFDKNHDGGVDPIVTGFPFVAGFELASGDLLLPVDTDSIRFPQMWPGEEFADLAVIKLLESAPATIPRYALNGSSSEVGHEILIAGYGNTGYGASGVDETASESILKRTGANRYDAIRDDILLVYDFDSGEEVNNALKLLDFDSDLGLGDREAMSGLGDSGGPVFVGGVVAGITSFGSRLPDSDIDDESNGSWGEIAFDVRLSSFQDFILTATDSQAVFVSEPSSAQFFWVVALPFWMRRGRRSSSE